MPSQCVCKTKDHQSTINLLNWKLCLESDKWIICRFCSFILIVLWSNQLLFVFCVVFFLNHYYGHFFSTVPLHLLTYKKVFNCQNVQLFQNITPFNFSSLLLLIHLLFLPFINIISFSFPKLKSSRTLHFWNCLLTIISVDTYTFNHLRLLWNKFRHLFGIF